MTGYPKPTGRRWQAFRQVVFRTYGRDCWICGHGGANQVDHLEPTSTHPQLTWVLGNCRPVHGVPANRCPVCGRACNQERQAAPIGNYRPHQPGEQRPLAPPRPEPAAPRPVAWIGGHCDKQGCTVIHQSNHRCW